ncbi:hypothetical protein BJV82DRAFT_611308, partial [Fennellomyces sp. T-0311]
ILATWKLCCPVTMRTNLWSDARNLETSIKNWNQLPTTRARARQQQEKKSWSTREGGQNGEDGNGRRSTSTKQTLQESHC